MISNELFLFLNKFQPGRVVTLLPSTNEVSLEIFILKKLHL